MWLNAFKCLISFQPGRTVNISGRRKPPKDQWPGFGKERAVGRFIFLRLLGTGEMWGCWLWEGFSTLASLFVLPGPHPQAPSEVWSAQCCSGTYQSLASFLPNFNFNFPFALIKELLIAVYWEAHGGSQLQEGPVWSLFGGRYEGVPVGVHKSAQALWGQSVPPWLTRFQRGCWPGGRCSSGAPLGRGEAGGPGVIRVSGLEL